MTAPADFGRIDPSLLAALRLVAQRPDVLAAAIALADGAQAPAGPTIGELWQSWAPWAEINCPSWRIYKTQATNFRAVKFKATPTGEARAIFDLRWKELKPAAGDAWREVRRTMPNGRGSFVKDSTINRELTVLLSMLNFHAKRGTIEFNPLAGVAFADESRFARKTYLTPEQVKCFIEAGHPMFQAIAWTAYRCAGMRHAEARLLRKSEIDWNAKIINLPAERTKARQDRVIPFPDDVEVILRRHCELSDGPFVFVDPRDPKRSRPVGGSAMQYWVEQARRRSGLVGVNGEQPVFHHLRHAGVTRLVESHAPESFIKAAAGMCGATMARYTHFSGQQQQVLREHMNRSAPPAAPGEEGDV